MIIKKYHPTDRSGVLVDVDVTRTKQKPCYILENQGEKRLFYDDIEVRLPSSIRHPLVRWIGDDRVLVVDSYPASNDDKNAFLIRGGNIDAIFSLGIGISNVLVNEKYIIVTYSDVGIFSGKMFENEGVVFFDPSGNYKFGYRSKFLKDAVDVSDCYCSFLDESKLFFMAYENFELVVVNLVDMKQSIHSTPERIHGSSAIVSCGGDMVVYSPYDEPNEVIKWNLKACLTEPLGKIIDHRGVRGVFPGTFLAVSERAYYCVTVG